MSAISPSNSAFYHANIKPLVKSPKLLPTPRLPTLSNTQAPSSFQQPGPRLFPTTKPPTLFQQPSPLLFSNNQAPNFFQRPNSQLFSNNQAPKSCQHHATPHHCSSAEQRPDRKNDCISGTCTRLEHERQLGA